MSGQTDSRLQTSFEILGIDMTSRLIYLYLLDKGGTKARVVAQYFNLPKTTALEKLYELETRGLVVKMDQKNSFIFHPQDPSIITHLLSRKEKEVEYARTRSIGEIAELAKQFQPKHIPSLEIIEGRENLQKMYLRNLKSRTSIYQFGDLEKEAKYFGNFIHDFWKLRASARIQVYSIMPSSNFNREISVNTDAKHLRKSYFYRPETKSEVKSENLTPYTITVYEDTVQLVSFDEEVGMVLEDKRIANTFRTLLQLIPVTG